MATPPMKQQLDEMQDIAADALEMLPRLAVRGDGQFIDLKQLGGMDTVPSIDVLRSIDDVREHLAELHRLLADAPRFTRKRAKKGGADDE